MKTFTAGLLLAGLMSSTAMAQMTAQMPQVNMGSALLPSDHMIVSPSAAPTSAPVAAPVTQEAPQVVSGVMPPMPGTIPVATIDQYNSMIVTLGYEAQIDKLNAEIAQSNAELAKAKAAEKLAESGKPDPATQLPPYMRGYPPGVAPVNVTPEDQTAPTGPNYPTVMSIFGSNRNLIATLKTDSGQIDTRVGDVLPGGFTVQRITGNGVLVVHDGKTQMLTFESAVTRQQAEPQVRQTMSPISMPAPITPITIPSIPSMLPVPPMGGSSTSAN